MDKRVAKNFACIMTAMGKACLELGSLVNLIRKELIFSDDVNSEFEDAYEDLVGICYAQNLLYEQIKKLYAKSDEVFEEMHS